MVKASSNLKSMLSLELFSCLFSFQRRSVCVKPASPFLAQPPSWPSAKRHAHPAWGDTLSRLPPETPARVATRAAHRCLPRTQQMALLDGVSPRPQAASASSCPIPAGLLGRGLQGKAGLSLGRRGELCSACFVLKTGAQST